MARRAISSEMYGKLVEAFFKYGQNWRACGAYAGVDARTAKIGWEKGWPAKGLPPIEDQIALKNVQARVARAEAAQKQAEEETARLKKAQDDAIETEKDEVEMLTSLRKVLVAMSGGALKRLAIIAVEMSDEVLQDHRSGKLKNLSVEAKSRLIARIAYIVRSTEESTRLALENERLHLGEPTAVLGLKMESITQEEAAEMLAHEFERFLEGKPLAEEVVEAVKDGSAQGKLH